MKQKLMLVTAGFGEELKKASLRLANQAESMGLFDEIVVVKEENLNEYCPQLLQKYPEIFNTNVKGFGYYSWKSEIINTLLKKNKNIPLIIFYLDAGCELNNRLFAKFIMRYYILTAKKNGFCGFKLKTPESHYTKSLLLKRLPDYNNDDFQIQATWFAISGEIGARVMQEWQEIILEDIRFIDSSIDSNESSNFIEHRWDQSILSLLVKKAGITISKVAPPSGKGKSFSRIKALFFPIWSARNRTGQTQVPSKYSIRELVNYIFNSSR